MTDERHFRIKQDQSPGARAKQSLMILSNELRLAVYRQGFQLSDPAKRDALLHIVNTEFDVTIPMPETGGVFYLVVCDGVPVSVPESDVLPFVVGYALAKGGVEAARRVSYRAEMLPLP